MYEFNKDNSGYIGIAFELTLKKVLERKHSDRLSPAGRTDFIYGHKYYEVKQNGGVAKYSEYDRAFRGSKRIIYATHVEHTIYDLGNDRIGVEIDLENTRFFVLDRDEFLQYLKDTNGLKVNESKGTINIQTMYNYTKDAYHGARGKKLEAWAQEHQIDDDILEVLFDKIYTDD